MIRFMQFHVRLFSQMACVFLASFAVLATPVATTAAVPDPVLEWIGIMNDATLAAKTNPLVSTRVVALVSAAVFDAVNGIDPRFQPLHVKPNAQHNASQRAAAIQAAYVILNNLFPAQPFPAINASLTAALKNSLAALATVEKGGSIKAGIAWGQTVGDAIWAWRLTDGFAPAPPPFLGAPVIGVWRPTPLGNAPGAGPQFASMTPWVLLRPSQFRPAPPLALASGEYAADVNETKLMGTSGASPRLPDQTALAFFWAGNTPLYWNRIAAEISAERHLTLTENAHLFALLNVSMADAGIACWDAKYRYVFWRPITAIRNADVDGNPATDVDTGWTPLLDATTGTPAHPEYPSGHSTVSGAAAFVLAAEFGDNTSFSVNSDVRPATETRSFTSFSQAVAEIANARVFAGIHFRTACIRGNLVGRAVAGYISTHAMRAVGDRDEEEDRD
jgi:membrane-associated phospholipid phosphatase